MRGGGCFAAMVAVVLGVAGLPGGTRAAGVGDFSLAQMLHYPYVSQLTSAQHGDLIAWVSNVAGVRNVWMARAPDFRATQLTHNLADDGQEITQLIFSPDATVLVFVVGGDHDANWPADGNLAPDPVGSPEQAVTGIWSVPLGGGDARKLADGDAPAISARGRLAYTQDDHVWTVPLTGGAPERLFFDRGKDRDLKWSPDGRRLAFVSSRGDHAFIGVFTAKSEPLLYLAPSSGNDGSPRWSPDGNQLAFVRRPGDGGPPEPLLQQTPHPWSIWVASAVDGTGRAVWRSPNTLAGSYPEVEGEANLHWMGGRLVFLAYLDDWPHLYSMPANGGAPLLLTPGQYMVEHVAEGRDGTVLFDANTGKTAGDDDRRHVFRVATDRAAPVPLTSGETLEWTPVCAAAERIAFVAAGPQAPPSIGLVNLDGTHRTDIGIAPPAEFPLSRLVVPQRVIFESADGVRVHGQLFAAGEHASVKKPGIIFVHGGPPRQMLLGWHYMEYYSNAYAVNQYLAAHGFIVLSVNYRLGIGYGRGFHQPEHAGFAGAAEYQDVLAGAGFLQSRTGVDARRIGIWGGSYGGYLTALGLARNSDVFKAGVDLHGVHDWSRLLDDWTGKPATRYERGDRERAMEMAWTSSPVSAVAGWKSPVLLIHGDDDRNVPFQQTTDLARRLEANAVPFEELIIPNEIHGFLRHASWLRADAATAGFFADHLGAP